MLFITQTPKDVPGEVLGQLGNRVQHALRVFTPDDESALRATVKTYPKSDFYDVGELLTSVGTGEAAITLLSAKGTPQPVVHSRLLAPSSKMSPAADLPGKVAASALLPKYGMRVDNPSARELLAARLEEAQALDLAEAEQKAAERKAKVEAAAAPKPAAPAPAAPKAPAAPRPKAEQKKAASAAGGGAAVVGAFLKSREGRALMRDVGRGVFGMLKKQR